MIISISRSGSRFRKVKPSGQGHMARKWWSKGLNPSILTRACRCLEALQMLIEGCARAGRGAEGHAHVHCGKPLNSSTPHSPTLHSPTKAYPALPEVGFVLWFLWPRWQWLLCNSAGGAGGKGVGGLQLTWSLGCGWLPLGILAFSRKWTLVPEVGWKRRFRVNTHCCPLPVSNMLTQMAVSLALPGLCPLTPHCSPQA